MIAAVIVSVFAGWGIDQGAATIIGMLSLMPALIVITVLLIAGWPRSIAGYVFLAIGGVFLHRRIRRLSNDHRKLSRLDLGGARRAAAGAGAAGLVGVHLDEGVYGRGPPGRRSDRGFRQYLGVAEEDRLNALNPPEKTPELFERFLPYAIALDVENAWATRFAEVLAAASVAAVADSWYSNNSGHDRTSDPGSFATYLGSSLSQTISSASTPPGSSGSSDSSSSSGSDGGGSSEGWRRRGRRRGRRLRLVRSRRLDAAVSAARRLACRCHGRKESLQGRGGGFALAVGHADLPADIAVGDLADRHLGIGARDAFGNDGDPDAGRHQRHRPILRLRNGDGRLPAAGTAKEFALFAVAAVDHRHVGEIGGPQPILQRQRMGEGQRGHIAVRP